MRRGSPSRNASPHPLVQAYLNSGEQLDVLAHNMPEPHDPFVQAAVALGECLQDKGRYEAAAKVVGALDLGACEPALHIIMLDLWSITANDNQRYEEVAALARRARALVSPQLPAEIRALVASMESFRVVVGGDLEKRSAKLKEYLDLMPAASPRRPVVLLNYVWSFATQGRMIEVEQEFSEVRAHRDLAALSKMLQLVDRVETGQAEAARSLIAELGPPSGSLWSGGRMVRQRATYRSVRAINAMIGGDSSLERAYLELGLADPRDPMYAGAECQPDRLPPWALAMHHLLERRPMRALEGARAHAAQWGESMPRETGIGSLNLLRTELACGHAEAARRLLDQRWGMGNIHYLDGLFLARLMLLSGDREAAARSFAAVLYAADRYGAHGRLDFELRMACEMSPGDIAWLGRAAGALQSTGGQRADGAVSRAAVRESGRPRLVGESGALAQIRTAVERLSLLDVPVLVAGETGTGKELVARMLHEHGPRRERPFVAINCGAIAETLLESELFGHEKGAFTGAEQRHKGIFEEAADGSVFLDEIGEISPRLQVMLLRVLETGEVRPVGSARSRRISCRVIAATNADLLELVEARSFRKDLYYRLHRMELRIPPVRERREDIVPLVEHFLAEGRSDGRRPAVSPRLGRWLVAREWPGNVRELRNFAERLRLLNSEKLEYDLADVPGASAVGNEGGAGEEPSAPTPSVQPATATDPVASEDPSGTAPAPAQVPAPASDEAAFLAGGRSPLRRRDRMRALFERHGKLTRQELAALLGTSVDTTGRDLKLLLAEGRIEKVEPTASPRTHYFKLKGSRGADARS
mgnify:CR=1 FL=1